ncbi:hypothetical protein J1N35_026577 [Gossypium stocksii]|uniref:Uncharacterized protein n=1 Tax=Gossypium stocksii TaxID=47602 RepID=A0A9D3V851_9ROSI|nr:hypothetical protein J1N35_026577 [Gossypium stocksii]
MKEIIKKGHKVRKRVEQKHPTKPVLAEWVEMFSKKLYSSSKTSNVDVPMEVLFMGEVPNGRKLNHYGIDADNNIEEALVVGDSLLGHTSETLQHTKTFLLCCNLARNDKFDEVLKDSWTLGNGVMTNIEKFCTKVKE